jgi:hypothetical protein
MGNSKGSYCTTTKLTMAAYDKLPPSARKALQDAAFCWATQPILTRWRNGMPGYRTGKDIAKTIALFDKWELAKRETKPPRRKRKTQ